MTFQENSTINGPFASTWRPTHNAFTNTPKTQGTLQILMGSLGYLQF